jgi:hypothetical protein
MMSSQDTSTFYSIATKACQCSTSEGNALDWYLTLGFLTNVNSMDFKVKDLMDNLAGPRPSSTARTPDGI